MSFVVLSYVAARVTPLATAASVVVAASAVAVIEVPKGVTIVIILLPSAIDPCATVILLVNCVSTFCVLVKPLADETEIVPKPVPIAQSQFRGRMLKQTRQ